MWTLPQELLTQQQLKDRKVPWLVLVTAEDTFTQVIAGHKEKQTNQGGHVLPQAGGLIKQEVYQLQLHVLVRLVDVALKARGEECQGRVDSLEGLGLSEHKSVSEMLQEWMRLRICSIV